MSKLSFNEVWTSSAEDGQPCGSTTAVSVTPGNSQIILPNHFLNVGRTVRITSNGEMSTIGAQALAPNFTFNVGVAGANALFNLGNSGNVLINTIAKNRVPFLFYGIFTVRTVSTTVSTAYGIFRFQSEGLLGGVPPVTGGAPSYLQPDTATAVSANFNYAAANQLSLTLAMNAFSSAVVKQYIVEVLN